MRKVILSIVALAAMVSWDCATEHAGADGVQVVHHARKMYRLAPVGCPSRYSCYSLYGAYGPYGGPAYWSRFTYGGWFR